MPGMITTPPPPIHKTSHRGLALIRRFEGFRGVAYLCPAGVPTIGYGTTSGVTHADVKAKRTITRQEAERLLTRDLIVYEAAVARALTRPPNQNQWDACVCFAYNVGAAGFAGSSVVKAHNRGDTVAAARAFGLWNKARVGGVLKPLPGLTARRAAEAALYAEPVLHSVADEMEPLPQIVEPERPMATSKINRASVAAGATATLAAVQETVQTVGGVKYGVESLGNWLVPGLLLAVVALCAYIVWERLAQRQDGAV